jgi:chromosome segregation ATPase
MASTPGTTALPSRTWFNNPQNPAEVCTNFDHIHSNLSLYGKGLDRHSEKIREDRKTIETVKSRLDAQERWNNHHEQLITDVEKKAEVDIERLRSDLDAEKAQSRQLATCLTKVVEAVAEIQRSFTAPRSSTVPGNRTPLENERRRSSQREAPLPEAVVKLSQRMDELSNQAVGNKTIVHANLQRIDRVIQENAQRIASLKGSSNMDNQRIESLERRSNMDNQRIDELELDVVHRFDTAVVNAQEGLRHNHDTWVKGLESLRAETMESITTTTNRLASDQKTVQSQVNEHTKTFEKHGEVLERISRRVKEVETARDSSGTAATACEAMTTSPKPLHTRLEVLENSHTALQTATLNLSTATTSASDLKDLRFEVDTLKSRSDNDIVVSVNLRNRVSALEESYETAAFAKIKERLTILEKSCSENNDAQSVMDNSRAKYVTHEQFIAATDSLASVLNTKIQNNKDELEKALACDIMMLEKQCSRQLESMKTKDENVVRENPCLVSLG